MKGVFRNPEERARKISLAKTGKRLTEEHRKKLSLAHLGKLGNCGMLGRKHSKETKVKMSLAKKGKMPKNIEIMRKGRRKKIDEGMGKIWSKNNHFTEETKIKNIERRKYMVLPLKDTTIEIKIQNLLKELGIEFFTHQYMKIEHGYQCDILIPSMNLVIECDGDYWHKYPIGNDLDHIRTKELIEKGFKVLRLWEFEIKKMNLNDFNERLEWQKKD